MFIAWSNNRERLCKGNKQRGRSEELGEMKKDTAAAVWLVWINKNLSAAEYIKPAQRGFTA